MTAVFLSLFVGYLGADRFYLGHNTLGAIKLGLALTFFGVGFFFQLALLSTIPYWSIFAGIGWFAVPIWWILDLIFIISGKERYNLE